MVEYRKAPLLEDFSLDPRIVLERVDEQTRLVFLCSPNNPSANLLDREAMLSLADRFHGLLVVDEAYIDFAPGGSLLPELEAHPNLVILQTLSKAWGAAGIRLGMALASAEIVGLLDRIKYPYNLNSLSLEAARRLIGREKERQGWTRTILGERERLSAFLKAYVQTEQVYPSDANFILARFREAGKLKDWLQQHGIVVRDRSGETHCRGCLRISVGSPEENNELIKWLERYEG